MAEWRSDDVGFLLLENHCPICAAAAACQGFCRAVLDIFRAVPGPAAMVERTDHILAGARRCADRIIQIATAIAETKDDLDQRAVATASSRPSRAWKRAKMHSSIGSSGWTLGQFSRGSGSTAADADDGAHGCEVFTMLGQAIALSRMSWVDKWLYIHQIPITDGQLLLASNGTRATAKNAGSMACRLPPSRRCFTGGRAVSRPGAFSRRGAVHGHWQGG